MPALKKRPADQGALAMQTTNRDVQNPLFLIIFIGSTLAAAALAISGAWTWDEGSAGLRLAGGDLFVVGNFLLTIAYHVPPPDIFAMLPPDPVDRRHRSGRRSTSSPTPTCTRSTISSSAAATSPATPATKPDCQATTAGTATTSPSIRRSGERRCSPRALTPASSTSVSKPGGSSPINPSTAARLRRSRNGFAYRDPSVLSCR